LRQQVANRASDESQLGAGRGPEDTKQHKAAYGALGCRRHPQSPSALCGWHPAAGTTADAQTPQQQARDCSTAARSTAAPRHAPSASSMYAMSGFTCCSVAIGCRCRRRLHTTPTKCSECIGISTARCRRRRMRGSASARWSKCSAVCGRWYSSSNTARSGRMRTAAGGFGGRNAGRSTCVNWCLQASDAGRATARGAGVTLELV
jgi:hypothetical protein